MKYQFCKLSLQVLFCFLTLASFAQDRSSGEKQVYLMSYFTGNGESGLHLAFSYDGYHWDALFDGKPVLKPTIGKDKLMRDPSIVQDDNGVFHMVWTTGWWDKGIGYAASRDLIQWTSQKNIPVMKKYPKAKNSWAPELFFDQRDKTFYILWASTIPGTFEEVPTSESEKGLNHRQFYTYTKDFDTFKETQLFLDPGFSVIDGMILKRDNDYYLFIKNENSAPAEKNIRYIKSKNVDLFSEEVSAPITGDYWAEGPSAITKGDYVYVYFDKYIEGKYGAVRSKDMKKWEDVSDKVVFPKGTRHGTIFAVSESFFENLISQKIN